MSGVNRPWADGHRLFGGFRAAPSVRHAHDRRTRAVRGDRVCRAGGRNAHRHARSCARDQGEDQAGQPLLARRDVRKPHDAEWDNEEGARQRTAHLVTPCPAHRIGRRRLVVRALRLVQHRRQGEVPGRRAEDDNIGGKCASCGRRQARVFAAAGLVRHRQHVELRHVPAQHLRHAGRDERLRARQHGRARTANCSDLQRAPSP